MKRFFYSTKKSVPLIEFVSALAVAAWFMAKKTPSWRERIAIAWRLAKSLFKREKRIDSGIAYQRMEICRRCPLFFEPLQTCGTPLGSEPDLGCWCYMPLKAGLATNCWIYDHTQGESEFGWQNELNTYEQKPSNLD